MVKRAAAAACAALIAGRAAAEVVVDAAACPAGGAYVRESGIAGALEANMPKVVALLDGEEAAKGPMPSVRLCVVEDFGDSPVAAAACAQSGTISLGLNWAKRQTREEVDGALVHEFAHIVQNYTRNSPPGWLVEGIADWVRWFNCETPERRAFIAGYAAKSRRHDGSYWVSAAFLDWVSRTYGAQVVPSLNRICREGAYDEAKTWRELTGRPLEALASEWRASLPARPKPEGAIDLATYNIRRAGKPDLGERDWTNRVGLVAGVVKSRRFDLMGLQEAFPKQIDDLRAALPGWESFGKGRSAKLTDEASPIFWRADRFEKLDGGQFWMSETPDEPGTKAWGAMFPRICTWVKLRDRRTSREFFYFNTHLDHASIEARRKGVGIILARIAEIAKGAPVVLSGDFNDSVVSDRLREEIRKHPKDRSKLSPMGPDHPISIVKSVLKDSQEVSRTPHLGTDWTDNTYGEKHIKRIDYIFVSDGIDVLSHETCCDRPGGQYPSDHEAVVARIALK